MHGHSIHELSTIIIFLAFKFHELIWGQGAEILFQRPTYGLWNSAALHGYTEVDLSGGRGLQACDFTVHNF